PAIEVAMVDDDRPAGAAGRGLERQSRIARAFRGEEAALERQSKGTETGEQVCDRAGRAGPSTLAFRKSLPSRTREDCLADRGDERSLAVRGRLEKGAVRQRHRHARESGGRRLRFPERLRAVAVVE